MYWSHKLRKNKKVIKWNIVWEYMNQKLVKNKYFIPFLINLFIYLGELLFLTTQFYSDSFLRSKELAEIIYSLLFGTIIYSSATIFLSIIISYIAITILKEKISLPVVILMSISFFVFLSIVLSLLTVFASLALWFYQLNISNILHWPYFLLVAS